MIDFMSYVALALVIAQLWLMGSNRYRWGWMLALTACGAWAVWCVATGAWALLAQQAVIAGLSVRALKNLPKDNS